MRKRLTGVFSNMNYDEIKATPEISETTKQAASGSSGRREIPDDFKYNPKKMKHLKSILHNVSVALGTLSSAFNEFSKFKGPDISPDGRLGGAGYILPLKDIKQTFQTSIQSLSDIADCLADEMTNPKWEAQANDKKEVKKLVEEKEEVEEQVGETLEEGAPKEETGEETPEVPEENTPEEGTSEVAPAPSEEEAPAITEIAPVEKQAFIKLSSAVSDALVKTIKRS